MDFKQVIEIISTNFGQQKIEYAFIGGFALGALGIMRSTVDIDLLVNKQDLPKIDAILTSHLYRLHYRSENVSQYVAEIGPLGSIDLLHAFRSHSLSMLQRARKILIFEGRYEIPVLLPEDLIGLKLQAAVNDPDRKTVEYVDIELLIQHFADTMNWELIGSYFALFKLHKDFNVLQEKYGNP